MEEAKERERMEEEKDARRAKREVIQAQIAPTGMSKSKPFGRKTEQKYRPDDTPAAKKRQLLRYEETLPWFLEDDDTKQVWEGTFESEMSEKHVMLTMIDHQNIQLAPLERWYRFNPQTKAKSTDDAELNTEIDHAEANNHGNGPLLSVVERLTPCKETGAAEGGQEDYDG